MKTILFTGSEGQLGQTFYEVSILMRNIEDTYVFLSHKDLDITNKKSIKAAFDRYKPDVVVNCAAYTNVEGAEDNKDLAYEINNVALENLKRACRKNKAFLIHFSTDYVYDGTKTTPYKETDEVNPLNIYGSSKLLGDMTLLGNENVLIFRVSWLYSNFGKNFFKTVSKFVAEGKKMNVVSDQVGTPTYARLLAIDILTMINNGSYVGKSGIYNYSDEGVCSWYDFAKAIEIFETFVGGIYSIRSNGEPERLIFPCKTSDRNDKAARPAYSVLDKTKYYNDFCGGEKKRPSWIEALQLCIKIENLHKRELN